MFPLFVAICAASLVGLVAVSALIADAGVEDRFNERFPFRGFAALTISMALLLAVMWIGRIADGLAAATATLHGETTMTVQALDLGLMVPLSVIVAIAALRRVAVGMVAAAAFGVTFVAMSTAIAAMMVSASIVTGVLQLPPIVVFGLAGAAGLALVARVLASAAPIRPPLPDDQGARPAELLVVTPSTDGGSSMSRIALLVLHGLVAFTAIGGAIWVVPTMPLDWIKAGPFEDWTLPAIALGFVGLIAVAAFVAVIVRPWLGALASVAAGSAMIVFELVEIAVVGWTLADPRLNGYFQAWLQPIFVGVGSIQLLLGMRLWFEQRAEAPSLPIIHPAAA